MRDSLTITVPSDPKYLCVIRAVTCRMAELAKLSETTKDNLITAVDEACSNVIKHAYNGDSTKRIVIKYKISPKAFKVCLEDTGLKARPELIKGRDLDDIRPGGLGIHLIKRAFDVFEFDPKRQKGNRLKLIKYL